jgi:hypothetical protein
MESYLVISTSTIADLETENTQASLVSTNTSMILYLHFSNMTTNPTTKVTICPGPGLLQISARWSGVPANEHPTDFYFERTINMEYWGVRTQGQGPGFAPD